MAAGAVEACGVWVCAVHDVGDGYNLSCRRRRWVELNAVIEPSFAVLVANIAFGSFKPAVVLIGYTGTSVV